jgi:nuclear transport factor 2 (NTF2) superfamily protein
MKIHSVIVLAGLAISFALPTFAQQQDTVDPQIRQQLEAIIKKTEEAFNNKDTAAMAALYTEDAVLESSLGVFSGRAGVEKYYLEAYQQFNPTDLVIRLDHIYAFGTEGFNRVFGKDRTIGGKIMRDREIHR